MSRCWGEDLDTGRLHALSLRLNTPEDWCIISSASCGICSYLTFCFQCSDWQEFEKLTQNQNKWDASAGWLQPEAASVLLGSLRWHLQVALELWREIAPRMLMNNEWYCMILLCDVPSCPKGHCEEQVSLQEGDSLNAARLSSPPCAKFKKCWTCSQQK